MKWNRLRSAWKRLVWLKVLRSIHPEIEVRDRANKRMRVNLRRHEFVGPALYLNGGYEIEFQDLMRYMNLEGSVCLDIGANVGSHTVYLSELVGSSGQVLAFEPESYNFRFLENNLKVNKITNVMVQKCAVGNAEGTCSLALSPTNYGDHRVAREAPVGNFEEVSILTIDGICKDLHDNAIKFIKIDVQGYEYYVLEGMVETLGRNPDAIIIMEFGPDALRSAGTSATELVQLLHDLGLCGWEFHNNRIIPLLDPWMYELITGRREENFILSRNEERIRAVLGEWYGKPLPQAVA